MIGHAAVHDECLATYDRTAWLLTDLGHEVEEIEAPFTAEVVPLFETVWSVLPPWPRAAGREEMLRPLTRWLRERGRSVAASDFAFAW